MGRGAGYRRSRSSPCISSLPVRESSRKRSLRRSEGCRGVATIAERDRECRIRANAANLAALDHIAVVGAVETGDEGHGLVQFDIAVARHRREAVIVRDEDVRTSGLERRNDRRGRAKQSSRPACHERGVRSVPPSFVVRPAAGHARVCEQIKPVDASIQRLETGPDQERIAARVSYICVGDPILGRWSVSVFVTVYSSAFSVGMETAWLVASRSRSTKVEPSVMTYCMSCMLGTSSRG